MFSWCGKMEMGMEGRCWWRLLHGFMYAKLRALLFSFLSLFFFSLFWGISGFRKGECVEMGSLIVF